MCATAPNQVYCWDITYLPDGSGAICFLVCVLDVFSRYIVGWQVYAEESSQHASDLMKDICWRENIQPNQVTLHSDNGSPMKGSTMLATLQALGIAKSFSRPAVSNDNPFAESVFNTLKHRPQLPLKRFNDVSEARQWAERLIRWYNHEHRHNDIRFVTPAQRQCRIRYSYLKTTKSRI
ncbi:MAG: transposase [Moraxellaceae bacterium]|nr:transposase [Moraxellaceae bacterium]